MEKQFLFEETKKISGMSFSKLPEEWRLYELFRELAYVNSVGFDGQDTYPTVIKRTEDKIIKHAKLILKKTIDKDDLSVLDGEISKFFYHEKSKTTHPRAWESYFGIPMLGPMSVSYTEKLLNTDDIKEVYSLTNNKSNDGQLRRNIVGLIHSEKCGWVAWKKRIGDKADQYLYLIAWKNHNADKSLDALYKKNNKFSSETTGRTMSRIFWSKNFWYHDDMETFNSEIPTLAFFQDK